MALTLPADLYPNNWVATVGGLSGAGAGVGTILSTLVIGWTADRYSFEPILIAASLIPLVATAAVLLLVRGDRGARTTRISSIGRGPA
jgi:sugar phosphate permease